MAIADRNSSLRRKLALIIGNGNYAQSYNKLRQPVNNANDLSNLLNTIGFHVTTALDVSKCKMATIIIDFADTITQDDLVLFYFSGHGYQVEGENYLLPVDDVNIKNDSDFEDFAVNFELTLARLVQEKPPYAAIFILDCCRPYSVEGSRTSDAVIDSKGLHEMQPPAMTFIQFACAGSQTVSDVRETDRNSLFTKYLLKNIATKNVDVREIFRRIANDVYRESNQQQKPLSMNGLRERQAIYMNAEVVPINDGEWDEKTEGGLASAKMEQAKLKAYYDSFPNIEDITSGRDIYIKEAEEFTKAILRNLPSGDATERSTACHILANLLANQNMQCLFFDSTHGRNLHDASTHLAEIESEDKPFVLKLSSSEGLGGCARPKTQQGEIRHVRALCRAIDQNQYHPVIEDIQERLSKAYEIDKRYIALKTTYVGTFNVVYTVKKLTKLAVESPKKLLKTLKQQFGGFISAKSHPLLNRPSFDISFFDERGNKRFPPQSDIYDIGPPGNTRPYIQPGGWVRFGLKVMGRYEDGDSWLDPFRDPRNWYRAFHGTKNASRADFGNVDRGFDQQYACIDAIANIYKKGFQPARTSGYGPGVYCSPNPKYPEQHYVGTVNVDTQQGKKRYQCMLQVAVNPYGVTFTKDNDIWVVPKPENIRSYGILIKEV